MAEDDVYSYLQKVLREEDASADSDSEDVQSAARSLHQGRKRPRPGDDTSGLAAVADIMDAERQSPAAPATAAPAAAAAELYQPTLSSGQARQQMDEESGAGSGREPALSALAADAGLGVGRTIPVDVADMERKLRQKTEEIEQQLTEKGQVTDALSRIEAALRLASEMTERLNPEAVRAIEPAVQSLRRLRTVAQAYAAAAATREGDGAETPTDSASSPGAGAEAESGAGDASAPPDSSSAARFAMPLGRFVYLPSAKLYPTDDDSVLCGNFILPEGASSEGHIDGTALLGGLKGAQMHTVPRLVGSQCALVRGGEGGGGAEGPWVQVTRWVFPKVQTGPAFNLVLGALRVLRRDVAERVSEAADADGAGGGAGAGAGAGGRRGALTLAELERAARRRSTARAAFDYSYAGLYVGPASRPPRVLTTRPLVDVNMRSHRQLLLSTARPSEMRASTGGIRADRGTGAGGAGAGAGAGALPRAGVLKLCADRLRLAHRKDWDESRRSASETASRPVQSTERGSRYGYVGQRWLAESHSQIVRPGAMTAAGDAGGAGRADPDGGSGASSAFDPRSGPSEILASSEREARAVARVVSQSQARGVTSATYAGPACSDEPETDHRMDRLYAGGLPAASHDRDATRDVLFAAQGLRAGSRVLLGGTLELLSPIEAYKVSAELRDPLTWQVQDASTWPLPARVVGTGAAPEPVVATAADAGLVPVLDCSPSRSAAIAVPPGNVAPPSSPQGLNAGALSAAAVGTHGLALQAFVPDARTGELPNVRLGSALDASPLLAGDKFGSGTRRPWTQVPENAQVRDWMLSVVHLRGPQGARRGARPPPADRRVPPGSVVVQRGALYALATLPLERAADLLTAETLEECTCPLVEAARAEVEREYGAGALGDVGVITLRREDPEDETDTGVKTLGLIGFSFVEAIADVGVHHELLQARGPLAARPQGVADYLDVAPLATLGLSPVLDMQPFPAHGTVDVKAAPRHVPGGDTRPAAPRHMSWWDALVRHPDMAPEFVYHARRGGDALGATLGAPRSTYARVALYMLDRDRRARAAAEAEGRVPYPLEIMRTPAARALVKDASGLSPEVRAEHIAAVTRNVKRELAACEELETLGIVQKIVKQVSGLSGKGCGAIMPGEMQQWLPISQHQMRRAHQRVYELMSLVRQLSFSHVDATAHSTHSRARTKR